MVLQVKDRFRLVQWCIRVADRCFYALKSTGKNLEKSSFSELFAMCKGGAQRIQVETGHLVYKKSSAGPLTMPGGGGEEGKGPRDGAHP